MAALNQSGEYLTLRPALPFVSTAPRSCSFAAGARRRTRTLASLRIERTTDEEDSEETLTGEWPGNFSMLNFEDLSLYLAPEIFKPEADPSSCLADVMSALRFSATEDTLLEEVEPCFLEVSGLPVLDKDRSCVGVVSKKDLGKASNGLKSRVAEVMTTPAITLSADKTVSDAAVTMLKHKIHRIPVTNDENQVIGMVTRTDIFTALGGK